MLLRVQCSFISLCLCFRLCFRYLSFRVLFFQLIEHNPLVKFSGRHALEEFIEGESRAAAAKFSVEEEAEADDWAASNFFFVSSNKVMPMPLLLHAQSDSGFRATKAT